VLPRSGWDPAAAAALLQDLADRVLRSEFELVLCLEAPEAVGVPRSLLRVDRRSVYQRHGGVRFATRPQLAMEARMLAPSARRRRAAPDPRRCRASDHHAEEVWRTGRPRRFWRIGQRPLFCQCLRLMCLESGNDETGG
jgi:hypothetical protein